MIKIDKIITLLFIMFLFLGFTFEILSYLFVPWNACSECDKWVGRAGHHVACIEICCITKVKEMLFNGK